MESWRVCRPVLQIIITLRNFLIPDPHKNPNPDSCQSEKSDLDPCKKLDPDADLKHCFEALSLTNPHVAERSVRRAAAIQMSTAVGSIAENTGGGLYAYRWDFFSKVCWPFATLFAFIFLFIL
jgi:hypothetical protein